MKEKKLIYKFIDNDTKTILVVEIVAHSGKSLEWDHNPEDVEGYVKWAEKSARWEMKLGFAADKIIREKYFNAVSPNEIGFGNFKLMKMKTCEEASMVNINNDPNPNAIRLKLVTCISKCVCKYIRGEKPANWSDIFSYDKIHDSFHYQLEGDEMSEKVGLREVARFNIPHEKESSKFFTGIGSNANTNANTNVNSNVNAQGSFFREREQAQAQNQALTGGGNDAQWRQKYLKYKKKHDDLKRTMPINRW